jgi:site-specific DNA recombinase
MLRRGRANTLIIAKLDRLSRSLRDVCALVEDLFSDEQYHLLSLCGMVNTHSAAGRMVLMNLANYNQFEREMISERTRDALQHMKAQGVRLGSAPYGYELSHEVDHKGRRLLVPLAHEQEVLRKIESLRAEGLKLCEIARRLSYGAYCISAPAYPPTHTFFGPVPHTAYSICEIPVCSSVHAVPSHFSTIPFIGSTEFPPAT